MLVFTIPSRATVITIELGSALDLDPSPYIVDIQQLTVTDHSEDVLLIENIEDPQRYKEWELTIWIPNPYIPLTQLDILDYKWANEVLEIPNVPLNPDPTAMQIPNYTAYYADTREAKWYGYGTQPMGSNWGRVDVGNPKWVSFHFQSNVPQSTPIFISIHDICEIPEPATVALLGLGALLLIRKKHS